MLSTTSFNLDKSKILSSGNGLTLYQTKQALNPFQMTILDSSKVKEFADDNFEFYENGRKFSKRVEITARKGEIAHYEQFLLFPQCFQKTCIAET